MPVIDHAAHTRYSDPGAYRSLLAPLPAEPDTLSAVARNVIVHYRASGGSCPSTHAATSTRGGSRGSSNSTSSVTPTHSTGRARSPSGSRAAAATTRCCAWRRSASTASPPARGWASPATSSTAGATTTSTALASPSDIDWGAASGTGFVTAAAAWVAHRRGEIDATRFGVDPAVGGLNGERFLCDEVIHEVAHRFGDELLLWDTWGAMEPPGTPVGAERARWTDDVADLLLAADAGDLEAEHRLFDQYRTDPGLHPGPTILQASPFGDEPVPVAL